MFADKPAPATPTPAPAATTPAVASTDTLTLTPTLTATLSAPMVMANTVNTNCRYGPGTAYLPLGALLVGNPVPILGTISDQSWWQINNPDSPTTQCWVVGSITVTTGNISIVPVVSIPASFVTDVKVTTPAVVHGTCGGPNATSFMATITTNGPAAVIYHLEIFNGNGTLRNKTSDTTRTFSAFGPQTFDPGGAYKTDCGNNFKVVVVVTSPNSKSASATWSVVSP